MGNSEEKLKRWELEEKQSKERAFEGWTPGIMSFEGGN